ncbi:MAG: S-layer homology domain-containing protein [Myxacorys californica WJT36-NPBG1]|jgi:hypothetical protein|nr:S-layer homology domain-containing protein [Myxacorys californica WJT36-NPBG1]
MSIRFKFSSSTVLVRALSLTVGTLAVLMVRVPVQAQTTFSDVQSSNWAAGFIQPLADRGIIRGFPDGSFRPNAPVTRAEFAVMVDQAFDRSAVRSAIRFKDVPSRYWASRAIQAAYTEGFLSGYPGSVFNPAQAMPRAQVLVALASGLQLEPQGTNITVIGGFSDYESIPYYAEDGVAAAVFRLIAVNYPNVKFLNPNRASTRAEVAASIYQALVASGKAPKIVSPYIFSAGGQ